MPFLPAAAAFVSANPWVIPAATSVASAAYRAITPDRQAELRDNVLNSQLMFRDQLARRAFGDFTDADRQQIQSAAEPQVNQIAAGVSRRGLGGSGAGAQVISQAQQRPFEVAQHQALQALPAFDAQVSGSMQALMGDGSFYEDLQATAALMAEELDNDNEAGKETDPETIRQIYNLWKLLGMPMPKAQIGTQERTYQGFQEFIAR